MGRAEATPGLEPGHLIPGQGQQQGERLLGVAHGVARVGQAGPALGQLEDQSVVLEGRRLLRPCAAPDRVQDRLLPPDQPFERLQADARRLEVDERAVEITDLSPRHVQELSLQDPLGRAGDGDPRPPFVRDVQGVGDVDVVLSRPSGPSDTVRVVRDELGVDVD
jgi:hypothetical protein